MNYDANKNNIDTTIDEQDIANLDDDIGNDEQSQRNSLARKRIDDLLEKKRLKYLLDDSEDWDI